MDLLHTKLTWSVHDMTDELIDFVDNQKIGSEQLKTVYYLVYDKYQECESLMLLYPGNETLFHNKAILGLVLVNLNLSLMCVS